VHFVFHAQQSKLLYIEIFAALRICFKKDGHNGVVKKENSGPIGRTD